MTGAKSDEPGRWSTFGERTVYDGYRAGHVEPLVTFRPMPGIVDAEHFAFVGRDPERIGSPTALGEAKRMEWVPLAVVPDLINADEIWDAGTLLALSRVLLAAGG